MSDYFRLSIMNFFRLHITNAYYFDQNIASYLFFPTKLHDPLLYSLMQLFINKDSYQWISAIFIIQSFT